MAEPTGLAAILADADAGEALPLDGTEQLALIGLALPEPRRSVGRPAGRRNKRNQRVADFILQTEGDPLVELMRMGMLGVADLANALGCDRLEAFAEKRQCLIAALPYIHQRQAIAIDTTNRKIVHLTIHDGAPGAASEQAGAVIGGVAEIVEIQPLSEGAADDV